MDRLVLALLEGLAWCAAWCNVMLLLVCVTSAAHYRFRGQHMQPPTGQRDAVSVKSLVLASFQLLTWWARCLPDVYLLGPACGQSGGHSWLLSVLLKHPQFAVCQSNYPHCASNYFSGRSWLGVCALERVFQLDAMVFRSFFPLIAHKWLAGWLTGQPQLVVDGTAATLLSLPQISARLGGVNRAAKAIVILPNPIERAHRHYCAMREHMPEAETRTFEEAVLQELQREASGYYHALDAKSAADQSMRCVVQTNDGNADTNAAGCLHFFDQRYLHAGLYAEQLAAFSRPAAFGDAGAPCPKLLVLGLDAVAASPVYAICRVCRFLGIASFAPERFASLDLTVVSSGGGGGGGSNGDTSGSNGNGNGKGNGKSSNGGGKEHQHHAVGGGANARGALSADAACKLSAFFAESNAKIKARYGIEL